MFQIAAANGAGAANVYIQYNIYGHVGHPGDFRSVDVLLTRVFEWYNAGLAPSAVSNQEICNGHFADIQGALGPLGYEGEFYNTGYSDPGSFLCSGWYGNSVFGWETTANNPSQQFAGRYSAQSSNGPEQRGIVCGVFPIYGFIHTACSTHLDTDPGTANWELLEAAQVERNTINAYPGLTHYLGGDLNLCYPTVRTSLNTLYTDHVEANGGGWALPGGTSCSAVNGQPLYTFNDLSGPFHSLTVKYDYAFTNSVFTHSQLFRYNNDASDHSLIVGYYF